MTENKQVEVWEGDFLEKGADLEHARWARWQKWVHSTLIIDPKLHDHFLIPRTQVERWERQINTPYSELSEQEKESDRKQVREYLPLISTILKEERERIVKLIEDGQGIDGGRKDIIKKIKEMIWTKKNT